MLGLTIVLIRLYAASTLLGSVLAFGSSLPDEQLSTFAPLYVALIVAAILLWVFSVPLARWIAPRSGTEPGVADPHAVEIVGLRLIGIYFVMVAARGITSYATLYFSLGAEDRAAGYVDGMAASLGPDVVQLALAVALFCGSPLLARSKLTRPAGVPASDGSNS